MQGITELEKREEITRLTSEERESLCGYRKEIQDLYKMEKIKWCQRARSKWLKEGNTNTAYFQRVANMRHRINTIQSLASPDGRIIIRDDIKTHTHEYFR